MCKMQASGDVGQSSGPKSGRAAEPLSIWELGPNLS